MPAPDDLELGTLNEYSHGDAGVYIVNVVSGKVECYGGYGKGFQLDPSKFPK